MPMPAIESSRRSSTALDAALGDLRVQLDVGQHERLGVLERVRAGLGAAAQLVRVGVGDPLGRERREPGLDELARLEELLQAAVAQRQHEPDRTHQRRRRPAMSGTCRRRGASRPRPSIASARSASRREERLTPIAGRQLALGRQPVARLELALGDQGDQPRGDLVGERVTRDRPEGNWPDH